MPKKTMSEKGTSSRIVDAAEELPRPFVDEANKDDGANPLDEAYARGHEEGRVEGESRAAESFERKLEGLHEEIAGALCCSKKSVESLLVRARKTLAEILSK